MALALTALLALLSLSAQVSARARPPALPAAAVAMAGMDADCMRAMAGASSETGAPADWT